jgi:hypothetical protein
MNLDRINNDERNLIRDAIYTISDACYRLDEAQLSLSRRGEHDKAEQIQEILVHIKDNAPSNLADLYQLL